MTQKQKFIIDYLANHDGQAFYVDIRDSMSLEFDNEEDFDSTLYQLVDLGLVHENKYGDTLYKVTLPRMED